MDRNPSFFRTVIRPSFGLATAAQRIARLITEDIGWLKPSEPDEAGRFFITDNHTGQRFAVTLKQVPSEPTAAKVPEIA